MYSTTLSVGSSIIVDGAALCLESVTSKAATIGFNGILYHARPGVPVVLDARKNLTLMLSREPSVEFQEARIGLAAPASVKFWKP